MARCSQLVMVVCVLYAESATPGNESGVVGDGSAEGVVRTVCGRDWSLAVSYTHLDVYKRQVLRDTYRQESPKIMLAVDHMSALPAYFKDIPDPRRAQGRRHPLPVVLAIAAGATLCGMDGYKAIAGWAKDLGTKARERFGCRIENRELSLIHI